MSTVVYARSPKDPPGIMRWVQTGGGEIVPVYRSGGIPDGAGLATRRQLRADGLSTRGLSPAGWLHYSPLHGTCPLYLREQAKPVRVLTPGQYANLAEGRKLKGTQVCARCQDARSLRNRKLCASCGEAARVEEAERRRAAELKFLARFDDDRAAASQWAAEVLSDPGAVVFDTETTGLAGFIVEAAAVRVTTREVLFRALVNPRVPIESGAQGVHGISDADVAQCPAFDQIGPELIAVLSGASRVVIYNREFDMQVMTRELARQHAGDEPPYTPEYLGQWHTWSLNYDRVIADVVTPALRGITAECAMERYAEWFGAWSDYHQSYTWQPLRGDHGAVGDCLAVIDRLGEMAASPARSIPAAREAA